MQEVGCRTLCESLRMGVQALLELLHVSGTLMAWTLLVPSTGLHTGC